MENKLTYSVSLGQIIDEFQLEEITSPVDRERLIRRSEVNRPGLALAGHFGYFEPGRIQIIGISAGQDLLLITHKVASKGDIWFHIKDYPGSHVVLLCDGAEPDAVDFTEAATVAAVYSKAPLGQRVTVDYTRIKNIKKPPSAKPGYVTFSSNYSAYVVNDPKNLPEQVK